MDKQMIRKQMRNHRRTLTEEEIARRSEMILHTLLNETAFADTENILTYISQDGEVDTKKLISECWRLKKHVYVPKVYGKTMDFHSISSFEDVEPGYFGILEPKDSDNSGIANVEQGLLIMPGIAFDKACNRIGYGGGFYDEYICRYPNLKRVALAYDFQMVEQIPVEVFDRPVDMIITESNVYYMK